ncbi:MAG: hypothetical protein ACE5EA_08905 [Nitrospirota bacterium]
MNDKSELLLSKKEREDISGFARVLLKKMRENNTSWNITIEAVEYLDSLTNSSPGLSFALLSEVDPEEKTIVTVDVIKEKVNDNVNSITKERLGTYYKLYNHLIKEKRLYSIFQR